MVRSSGYYARRPTTNSHLVLFRGTMTLVEWLIDAECEPDFDPPTAHAPSGGYVETGFFGVYASLRAHPIGSDAALDPVAFLRQLASAGAQITIAGHSLGATVALYLLAELGAAGVKAKGRLIAPPRAGNKAFATWADTQQPDLLAYAAELDLVPRVPPGPAYAALPRTIAPPIGWPEVKIGWFPTCQHHAASYGARIQPDAVDLATLLASYRKCIRIQALT